MPIKYMKFLCCSMRKIPRNVSIYFTNATVKLMKIEFNFYSHAEWTKTTKFPRMIRARDDDIKTFIFLPHSDRIQRGVALIYFNLTLLTHYLRCFYGLWLYYIEKLSLNSMDKYSGDVNLIQLIKLFWKIYQSAK